MSGDYATHLGDWLVSIDFVIYKEPHRTKLHSLQCSVQRRSQAQFPSRLSSLLHLHHGKNIHFKWTFTSDHLHHMSLFCFLSQLTVLTFFFCANFSCLQRPPVINGAMATLSAFHNQENRLFTTANRKKKKTCTSWYIVPKLFCEYFCSDHLVSGWFW